MQTGSAGYSASHLQHSGLRRHLPSVYCVHGATMRDSENTEFERLAVYTPIVTDNAKLKQLIIEITVGVSATKRVPNYT